VSIGDLDMNQLPLVSRRGLMLVFSRSLRQSIGFYAMIRPPTAEPSLRPDEEVPVAGRLSRNFAPVQRSSDLCLSRPECPLCETDPPASRIRAAEAEPSKALRGWTTGVKREIAMPVVALNNLGIDSGHLQKQAAQIRLL
jgi:hypothetical protein